MVVLWYDLRGLTPPFFMDQMDYCKFMFYFWLVHNHIIIYFVVCWLIAGRNALLLIADISFEVA